MRTASLISLAAAAVSIVGCNALSGVDDFEFNDQPADASIEGAAGNVGKDAAPDSDAQEVAIDAADEKDSTATEDAEASVDAPVDAADDTADASNDVADGSDASDSDAAEDASDSPVTDVVEGGDAPLEAEASTGCNSNNDCSTQTGTPYCDKPSGKCVECLIASDPCPQGKYCAETTLTCEAGCKDNADCTGGATCNVATHQCLVPAPEVCTGGLDEDFDGRIDCFDTDCAASTSCKGFCTDAETVACGTVVTGKNSGGAGSTQRLAPPAYSCTANSYPGPERAFKVTGADGKNLIAEIYGLSADLAVLAVDPTAGAQCNAGTSCDAFGDLLTSSNAEALGIAAQAGKDHYVVVDGPAAADFSLSVQCIPAGGCLPARAIQSGQSISARNELGVAPNITSNLAHHSTFATSGWLAPEAAFVFTPTVSGSYTITAKGLNGGGQFDCDLDLFLLASTACGEETIANGATTGIKSETITSSLTANTTYFIMVDGYATEGVPCISDFILSVTGP